MKWPCFYILIALFCITFSERSVWAAPERPVVVIPGILGSKLCREDTKKVVWGGASSLSNLRQLALPLDPKSPAVGLEVCGILESIRVVGPFKFHQYDQLLDTLRGYGYVEGKTLFVFAYDWRLSNFDTARTLAEFVRQKVGNRPFDIVAHSMGGLVARIYLRDHEGGKRVARLVTMGTPHRGSVKILRIADSGWSWWENALAGGIGQIRETLMTFPSVYELLPSYPDCCVLGTPNTPNQTSVAQATFSPISLQFWKSLSLLPDHFRSEEGHRFLQKALENAERLHTMMKAPIPGNVKFAPLVTGLMETEWRAYVDPKSRAFVRWDSNFGDGTVYEKSAANMQLFDARPSDVEHQRIFNSDSARQVLRWALMSGVDPTAGRSGQDYRATINAGPTGIEVTMIELSVTPDIIRAGSTGEYMLRIRGKKALAEIDFPVKISLSGPKGEFQLTTSSTAIPGDDLSTERIFRATFTAPAQEGTHSISAAVPGLEPLQELFEVIP